VENVVSQYVRFDKNLKLILHYYRPFKSDPSSQQKQMLCSFFLPKYSYNNHTHTTENNIIIHGYILKSEYFPEKSEFSNVFKFDILRTLHRNIFIS